MKNYYYQAIQFDSLYKAMKRCCRNLRWKCSITGYEFHGIWNTYKLRKDLMSGSYEIRPYQHFVIYEPKRRDIIATRFRDRQFQMALCQNGLYDDVVEHFILDNPACQINKGTDYTFHRLKVQLRKYFVKYGNVGWVLHCDIKKFFPNTNHKIAKREVSRYISDQNALNHVFTIIDSFGDEKGIGLGSQISQLIELTVLNRLDHYIRERLRPNVYIRYMDDITIVHYDKNELAFMLNEIIRLLKELKFEVNKKTQIYPLHKGVKLMNWTFYISNTGKIIQKMSKKKYGKQRRRTRKLWEKEKKGELEPGTTEESARSFLANANRGNTYFQRRRYIVFYNKLTGTTYSSRKKGVA